MLELALGFSLLFFVVMADRAPATPPAAPDPCEMARVIVEQGACVRAEDCGAFDGWMRLFGEPRTEPLDPELTRRPRHPATYLCPARGDQMRATTGVAPRHRRGRRVPGARR